jgi:hypothetical protein
MLLQFRSLVACCRGRARLRALTALCASALALIVLATCRAPWPRAHAGLLPSAARLEGTVLFERFARIYAPDEVITARVRLRLIHARKPSEKAARVNLKWKLTAPSRFHALAEGAVSLQARWNAAEDAVATIELRAPAWSGVAALEIRASGTGFPDIEEVVNLAILGGTSEGAMRLHHGAALIDEIDGLQRGSFRRVQLDWGATPREQRTSRLLRPARDDAARHDASALETRAFRLKAARALGPHKLVVNVRSLPGQPIELALLETSRDRELSTNGPVLRLLPSADWWNATEATGGGAEPIQSEHVLYFWPNARECILAARGVAPGFELLRARLYELESSSPHPPARREIGAGRLCGASAALESLAANVGLSPAPSPVLNWEVCHQAASRMAALLEAQGYNALLLSVPAHALKPGLRSAHPIVLGAGAGQTLGAAEAVALIGRVLERQGMVLVPELSFSGALAAIEEQAGPMTWLIDAEGRHWPTVAAGAGQGPGYNVLDPAVQEAVAAAIEVVCQPLARGPAFAGVALRLGPDSFVQFPSLDWGYDRSSVGMFLQESSEALPPALPRAAMQDIRRYLRHEGKELWTQWRCRQVAAFHRRLAEVVSTHAPQGRLFLTGAGPLMGAGGPERLVDLVRQGQNPAQRLAEQGLDFAQYRATDQVTVLRPLLDAPAGSPLQVAACSTLNSGPGIHAAYRSAEVGVQIARLNLHQDVPGEASASWRGVSEPWTLALASVEDSLRRLTLAQGAFDAACAFEGSDTVPSRVEESLARQRRIMAQLPRVPFTAVEAVQPLVVRSARAAERSYVYMVNAGAARCGAEVLLEARPRVNCIEAGTGRRLKLTSAGERQKKLLAALEPGQAMLLECDDPALLVAKVEARVAGDDAARLRQRIDGMHRLLSDLDEPRGRNGRPATVPALERIEHEDAYLRAGQEAGVTVNDLRQLTKTLSSARLALEEGRYADCQRLLDGYWGRLLFETRPKFVAEGAGSPGQPRRR